MSIVHIGRGRVLRTNRPAHPLFVPPDLIHTVVVTSGVRHSGLVKLWMEEQRSQRVLSAGRCAENTDAADIVVRVLRGYRLVPEDAIRKTGIRKILERHVVKRLRP